MVIRTSSYNIYVKLPKEGNYLIVQGYTGAVDRISKSVYDYLKSKESIEEQVSPSTIKQLTDRGYITHRSFEEEREHLKRIAEVFHRRHLKEAVFLFAPTFSCQLRCIYCYEASIAHRDDKMSQSVMSSEHIRAAYSAIDKIIESMQKKPPDHITLYGGEPLMAKNYEIVREIVEEGIKRKFHLRAITNGYDLLAYENLLGKYKIDHLQITIDGPEEVHNRRRFTKEKMPTFKEICAGVQLALDKGCTVSLRTNVDRSNLGSLKELNGFYIKQGWNNNPNFHPYAYVTHDWHREKLITPKELLIATEEMFSQCEDQNVIKIDFGINQCFGALLRPEIPSLRPYFCGANIGMYIFGPDGYIYTCWDEVGLEEGIIGSYMPDLSWNEERSKEWLSRNIAKMAQCLDCPYALICGGGCSQQAKKRTGSIMNGYCHQFQELFQYLTPDIYIAYAKMKEMRERKTKEENGGLQACN